jgi:hypothetical protein
LAKCDLLAKLGITNLVAGLSGDWIVGGGLDANLLQTGDKISLWRGEGTSMTKVGESTITMESSTIVLDNKSLKAMQGDVYSFRIDSTQARATVREGSREVDSAAPAKPSLKERLKFD